MLTIETDEAASAAVWLFTGRQNADADYERYVASLAELARTARRVGHGAGLLVAERDNPPPNATWRKRIADASRHYPPNCAFALVSESMLVRSVITAVNWLRPPTYDFVALATVDEALAWIAARRGDASRDAPRVCLERARRAAGR
jgi:hypothetical protein